MASAAAVVTTLAPGTYWLDWQVDGDITFTGPWAPPVTIDGQTTTGNALQSVAAVWQPVVDATLLTPLGLPFIVDGTFGDQFLDGFETSGHVAMVGGRALTGAARRGCGREGG